MVRSLADRARERADEHPFLREALAAGVVNYTAAARFLFEGEDEDEEAVATALRRYGESLSRAEADHGARVSMESGVGPADAGDALLRVGDTAVASGRGEWTALVATGDVTASDLGAVLGRCSAAGIDPVAAGGAEGSLVVVVERTDGADTLRVIEDALEAVPVVEGE